MSEYKCKVCGKEIGEYEHSWNNGMCFDCIREEQHKNLSAMLQKNLQTSTDYEDEIVCPYCGYRMEDTESYYIGQGQGEDECPECGKTFDFEVHIEVTYSTSRKEEDEQ